MNWYVISLLSALTLIKGSKFRLVLLSQLRRKKTENVSMKYAAVASMEVGKTSRTPGLYSSSLPSKAPFFVGLTITYITDL